MRKLRFASIWLATVCGLLAACTTTLPQNTSFKPSGGKALLLLVVPNVSWATSQTLRRVNLETRTFEKDIVTLESYASSINDNTHTELSRVVTVRAKEVEPGEYALVETFGLVGGAIESSVTQCLRSMAPVFSVSAGQINVVRVDFVPALSPGGNLRAPAASRPTETEIMQEVKASLAQYPGMVGAPLLAPLKRFIQWPEKTPSFLEKMSGGCAVPAGFTFAP